MKKYLLHIGAIFLMALYSLPAMAQISTDGYYRIRNAERSNEYITIANDKFNFSTVISRGAGLYGLAAGTGKPYATNCAKMYLRNDIHLVENTNSQIIRPAEVIYADKQKTNVYNLIAQGTSLLTLATGCHAGNATLYFKNGYLNVVPSGSGENTQYTAQMTMAPDGYSDYAMGPYYFTDSVNIFNINASSSSTIAKWYIEPLTYFNVKPDLIFHGKYYTTLFLPFSYTLGENINKAYVITNSSLEHVAIASSGEAIPAGTPVILECNTNEEADCKLYLTNSNVPIYTPADESITTGAPAADETTTNYSGTNILKGTYYCNTDGQIKYTYCTREQTGTIFGFPIYDYFEAESPATLNGNHYTTISGKYQLGINTSGKLGFITATGIAMTTYTYTKNETTKLFDATPSGTIYAMPANKAWLTSGGTFPSAPAPEITPSSSTSNSPIEVTITCKSDATIHYTTDGSDPTWESPEYTEPITLNESATVKAIAIKPGLYNASDVVSESYTINLLNPTLSVEPTSLIINDSGTNNSFTVIGENLVDDIGLSRSTDIFNHTLAATEGTTDSGVYNGNPWWAFRKSSDNKVNGTVTVSYPGRELTATGTFTVGTKKVSGGEDITETVTVTYQPDIYLYGDFGNGWKCGDQMSYSNGEYSATITTTGNTYLLFARKAVSDNSYGWNTDRLFFGANTNGDNWLYVNNTTDDLDVNANVNRQYHPIEIKLEDAGKFIITINAQSKKFTITKIPESTLAYIESNGVVGNAYTVTDELIGVWAVNNDNDKLLWAKDQGNVSIDKRPAKTDDQTDYMVTHMKYQHYPWEGYDWDESNWVILDFAALNENPESYVGHKLENKSVSGIYSDANNYTIKLSDAPIFANGDENILDAPDYPGYAGVHSESNYGTKYAWAYNTYIPANFNEDNLNRLVDSVIVGAQSGPNALDNMQDQQLYFMNPKFMEIAHIWGIWEDNGANGRFVMIEPSFANNQTVNAWDLHGAVDVINWKYNRKDQNNYGQPHQLTEGAHDFHALIVRKSTGSKLTSDPSSGSYGIMPLDLPENGHPTAVKELIGNHVIKSISYYNVMGMESSRPFKGINIVVTRYSDGSSTTTKVLR